MPHSPPLDQGAPATQKPIGKHRIKTRSEKGCPVQRDPTVEHELWGRSRVWILLFYAMTKLSSKFLIVEEGTSTLIESISNCRYIIRVCPFKASLDA